MKHDRTVMREPKKKEKKNKMACLSVWGNLNIIDDSRSVLLREPQNEILHSCEGVAEVESSPHIKKHLPLFTPSVISQ